MTKKFVGSKCTAKKVFLCEQTAVEFHEKNKATYPGNKPQKAYRCKHCYLWHLSSRV